MATDKLAARMRWARVGITVAGGGVMLLACSLLVGALFVQGIVGLACVVLGLMGIVIGAMVLAHHERWRIAGIAYAGLLAALGIYDAMTHDGSLVEALGTAMVLPAMVVAGSIVGRPAFMADPPRLEINRTFRSLAGVLVLFGGSGFLFLGFMALGFNEGDAALAWGGVALMMFGAVGIVAGIEVMTRHARWWIVGMAFSVVALLISLAIASAASSTDGGGGAFLWALPPALTIAMLWAGRVGFAPPTPPRPDT